MLRNVKTQHIFEDICYVMAGGGRCAKHAGYCATPTGPRFKRNCFTDPAAKPFFEMRKFIADRRPRLVILENVRGLLAPNPETDASPIEFILRGKNPDKKEHCYEGTEPGADWGLQFIEGYGLRWDVFYSCDWGLPQSRPRVYIVMVRDDAGGQEAAERMFDILKACMGRLPQGAFSDFLFEEDDPRLLAARQDWAAKAAKRDGLGRVPLTKFSEALFRTMREQLGLKASDRPYSGSMPEGWLPHCTEKQVQSLDVVWAQAERQGADLNFLLADLSQQVSRGCWRDDGNIPTLTTGCMLYSYARERLLLGEECLLLNGFPIDHLDLQNHSQAEMIFLAGNTMSIPLVGAVLFAGLVALDWGPDRSVTVGCHELPAPVSIRADARKLEEKKHTGTMNLRFPRKHGKLWEVGGKTETQKIWEHMRHILMCVCIFVCVCVCVLGPLQGSWRRRPPAPWSCGAARRSWTTTTRGPWTSPSRPSARARPRPRTPSSSSRGRGGPRCSSRSRATLPWRRARRRTRASGRGRTRARARS
ncbi:unnamed protein product [Prorocentrum cordatum]|uniref:DNA (cytosine-5-)-methyltransferase n=1 Tax=Prorocentrum cordatum TaxID=2364126 RepID=A0ABN9XW95_9DINO|nr:unnamed protein product [Polarella glacialis]